MSNSSYPTNPSAVTSMAPAGTQYVPIPPFRHDSYYVAHSVDDILRYPPPSISTYSRRHVTSLYERHIQTDPAYSLSTEQYVGDAAQHLHGTEQHESIDALPAGSLQTEYTVQTEVQTGPINGVQQALDFRHSSWPADDELQSNMTPYNAAENNIPVYNAAACAAPMYNTSGYEQGTDQFLRDGGMVPHNTPMPYVTTAYQVPMNTIAMPGIPYDMHSRHPSNHDNVAPHNIAPHSTVEHYAPEYSVTTYSAPMGNAPVYTAVIDQFAADSSELPYNTSVSYNATMHQLPMHTLGIPNAVGGTQDIGQYLPNHDLFPENPHASGYVASVYDAPPDVTWVYDIPHAMQDVGQVAPDNGGQMPSTYEPVYDAPAYTGSTYQMSMDIGQTYQGPMGTMAMPNAPGGAHGMDQPDPESLTHSLQTGQRAPSTSSLQEWVPVEPSSGPVRQKRRQRRNIGSKAKGKGKARQGHLSPAGPSPASSSDSGYGSASPSTSNLKPEDKPEQPFDQSMTWGPYVPPPGQRQRRGWSCLECGGRAKKCTGNRSTGEPCPECYARKTPWLCQYEPTLDER